MLKLFSKSSRTSSKPADDEPPSPGLRKKSSVSKSSGDAFPSGTKTSVPKSAPASKNPKKSLSGGKNSLSSVGSKSVKGTRKVESESSPEDEGHVTWDSVDTDPSPNLDSLDGDMGGLLIGGMRKNFEGTEKSGHLTGVPLSLRLSAEGGAPALAGEKQATLPQSSSRAMKPSNSTAAPVKKLPVETPELELMPALEACATEEPEEQLRGLKSLRILSRGHKLTRLDMVAAGAVETVLQMQGTEHKEVLNMMLLVLLNLTFDDESVHEMGVIIPFVERCLAHEDSKLVEDAAAVVFSLSRLEDHRTALLLPNVVEALVKVLASGTEQGKRDSCKALFHLSYLPDSYPLLLGKGTVEPAIELLLPPDSKIAEKAVCLLANIARSEEGCQAIAECEEGLANLVEILGDGSHMAKEFAAAALLLVAQSNKEYKDELVLESPFIALNGLQNSGTARAKLKACALLRLLRDEVDEGQSD